MKPLFKTEEAKKEILSLYDRKLEELDIDYEYLQVNTSYGETNIIAAGSKNNPPIILVHGSNACAPIALETYPTLDKHFKVYAIDVLAQPNKSSETRLSMKDDSYGKWMAEVIENLRLDEVTMAGFSLGGLVILKTLEYKEDKIKEVFLSAPCYIVNGNPLKALFKVFIPMKRYMKTKKSKYVEKFLSELFTDRDPFAIDFLSSVFKGFNMDFSPVPVISTNTAKSIKTPITLFAAEQDLLFPGKKMIKRATNIFPSLKKAHLLEDSKHVQSKSQNTWIEKHIIESKTN
jgi:pimeloyl-ACP methyl ester carboxylesterase